MPKNNTMTKNPIGVMDSGVGGISVLKHIHALLPHEHLIYVADSAHAPYGNKSQDEIKKRCFAVADFLIAQEIKALVVACNTATAAAINDLRAKYALPIIGMEPAVKPAAAASKNGIIGVLATVGTLKSAQFAALLESYGRNVEVVTQGCIGLVECIERGELDTEHTQHLLQQYCAPLLAEGADTIVLGCTHYPFVRHLIEKIVGESVSIIDTGAAVANHVNTIMQTQSLSTPLKALPTITFWTNSKAIDSAAVIRQLWANDNADIRYMS
ncbi:MAG: glutamate racemase [Methylophilaceae bacterium 17-44-8]|nr:MAG: glutamate racemase [Methylophilales bacterium 28-44-11]OYZ10632.1 MAG: glutamate racemase [Methylophilales bacterium 16-45-7]OZA06296.1 MAG: glutamate racemase [Methylophilaceae bacterium 17-44-8]